MMDRSDADKTAMPPPFPAGTSSIQPTEFGMQPPQQYEYSKESSPKKQCLSSDEEPSPNSSNMDMPALRNVKESIGHTDPIVLWQDSIDQVQKLVETVGREWSREWTKLHEEEKVAMERIWDLCKTAHDMNVSFHQQMDGLHNNMMDLVSSLKK